MEKDSASPSNLEALGLRAVIAGLTALALLPVGMVIGIHNPIFTIVGAIHFIAFLALVAFSAGYAARLIRRSPTFGSVIPTIILGIVSIAIVLLGALPVTARDALIHHLAVPKWWIASGSISEISWHDWSYYPMLLNLGFTVLLQWGFEAATSWYHAGYLFVFAAAVAAFLERKTNDKDCALLGFFVTISTPVCLKLATVPLVDLGLSLYGFLAAALIVEFSETPANRRLFVLAGVALGLALGTKFNGILYTAIIIPLFFILAKQKTFSLKTSLGLAALLGLTALAVYSPWLIKNALWTGNPLYPLFQSTFGAAPQTTARAHAALPPIVIRHAVYGESWLTIALMPFRIFFEGQDDSPRYFDGVLSPLLLIFLLSFARAKKERWVAFFLLLLIGYIGLAFLMTAARIRYLAPVFGLLFVMTAYGMKILTDIVGEKAKQMLLIAFACGQAFISFTYLSALTEKTDALDYLLRGESREVYLTKQISEYKIISFINETIPENATVYLLYTGNRFYLYKPKVFSGGFNSEKPLLRMLETSDNASLLALSLKNSGVHYLLSQLERERDAFLPLLNEKERQVWGEFERDHLVVEKVDGPYALSKIR